MDRAETTGQIEPVAGQQVTQQEWLPGFIQAFEVNIFQIFRALGAKRYFL